MGDCRAPSFARPSIWAAKLEKVEAGTLQFAGSQTANRLVLTVGKLSVVDIFDTNKYAHDPRTDFMNWAMVDTAIFDYAAEAWGYTYGAAAEWYQGNWTVRGGLFDLSVVPNSPDLDPSFSQVQWVGEIERRYDALGPSGQDRRQRVPHPRPHGNVRGRDRAGGDHRWPGRYRGRPSLSKPRRHRHEYRAGDHARPWRVPARRLGRRQHRAVRIYRCRQHRRRRRFAQWQEMGPTRTTRSALPVSSTQLPACIKPSSMQEDWASLSAMGNCRIRVSSKSSRPITATR